MRYIFCFCALLFLESCETTETIPNYEREMAVIKSEIARSKPIKKEGTRIVRIETLPPKRKIMVNNEYVGDSPISIKLPVYDKDYTSNIKVYYRIEAYPIRGDAQSQVKIVELVECDECGEEKPFRIFMDMMLENVKP